MVPFHMLHTCNECGVLWTFKMPISKAPLYSEILVVISV